MLTNLPAATEDQTIESLVATTCLRNPIPRWNDALKATFGDDKVRFNSALQRGWKRAYEAFRDIGHESPEAFINAHSYLPIFKHALGSRGYASLLQDVLADRIRHLGFVSINKVLRDGQSRFCQACVDTAVHDKGYACALRAHQILGVFVCPDHGLPLLHCQDTDRSIHSFLRKGIILPPFTLVLDASSQQHDPSGASSCLEQRYAKFVQAALRGRLATVSSSAFQDAIHSKLHVDGANSLSHESAVAWRLEHQVPPAIRADIDAVISSSRSNWPLKVLDGSISKLHPLASLLLITTVFADASEFNRYAERAENLRASHLREIDQLRYGVNFEITHPPVETPDHASVLSIQDKVARGRLIAARTAAADILVAATDGDRALVNRVLACFIPDRVA